MYYQSKIAITMGDPAGIGPEIIIKALDSLNLDPNKLILIGNKNIFNKTSQDLSVNIDPQIEIIDIDFDASKITTGLESVESGKLSFLALEHACKLALNKKIKAIVTAPLSKNAINMAGYHYSGQTEILEKHLGQDNHDKAEMLFVAGDFKVLLLTRHIKLVDVPKSLTKEGIVSSAKIVVDALKHQFNINNPKIAFCGLNPHAGEDGLIGREEIEIIKPAIEELKTTYNIDASGPFPADTLFVKAGKAYRESQKQPYDCYFACYHDQGLTPIKVLAMDKTVNTTVGLPILRTSPAHGTAFDIAGKNTADCSSMKEAIKLALDVL